MKKEIFFKILDARLRNVLKYVVLIMAFIVVGNVVEGDKVSAQECVDTYNNSGNNVWCGDDTKITNEQIEINLYGGSFYYVYMKICDKAKNQVNCTSEFPINYYNDSGDTEAAHLTIKSGSNPVISYKEKLCSYFMWWQTGCWYEDYKRPIKDKSGKVTLGEWGDFNFLNLVNNQGINHSDFGVRIYLYGKDGTGTVYWRIGLDVYEGYFNDLVNLFYNGNDYTTNAAIRMESDVVKIRRVYYTFNSSSAKITNYTDYKSAIVNDCNGPTGSLCPNDGVNYKYDGYDLLNKLTLYSDDVDNTLTGVYYFHVLVVNDKGKLFYKRFDRQIKLDNKEPELYIGEEDNVTTKLNVYGFVTDYLYDGDNRVAAIRIHFKDEHSGVYRMKYCIDYDDDCYKGSQVDAKKVFGTTAAVEVAVDITGFLVMPFTIYDNAGNSWESVFYFAVDLTGPTATSTEKTMVMDGWNYNNGAANGDHSSGTIQTNDNDKFTFFDSVKKYENDKFDDVDTIVKFYYCWYKETEPECDLNEENGVYYDRFDDAIFKEIDYPHISETGEYEGVYNLKLSAINMAELYGDVVTIKYNIDHKAKIEEVSVSTFKEKMCQINESVSSVCYEDSNSTIGGSKNRIEITLNRDDKGNLLDHSGLKSMKYCFSVDNIKCFGGALYSVVANKEDKIIAVLTKERLQYIGNQILTKYNEDNKTDLKKLPEANNHIIYLMFKMTDGFVLVDEKVQGEGYGAENVSDFVSKQLYYDNKIGSLGVGSGGNIFVSYKGALTGNNKNEATLMEVVVVNSAVKEVIEEEREEIKVEEVEIKHITEEKEKEVEKVLVNREEVKEVESNKEEVKLLNREVAILDMSGLKVARLLNELKCSAVISGVYMLLKDRKRINVG